MSMLNVGVFLFPGFATNMLTAGGKYGTPLRAALARERPHIKDLLLARGADPNL
jgi:hypothetical protein